MVTLLINNKEVKAAEGTPLVEVCRENGIVIPTLCHNSKLPHFTSCMVCMVSDRRSGKFIPSCSALPEEGMDIDTSSAEVRELRNEALTLLLAEHRAECEAPCRLVCPEAYDIPLFNRMIANGEYAGAARVVNRGQERDAAICNACPGYCEKACRRKMIDSPISIRSLISFVIQNFPSDGVDTQGGDMGGETAASLKARFNSVIGRIADHEKQEWLKETSPGASRADSIDSLDSARGEAGSCLHCDCRAAGDCRLRELSEEAGIKNPVRLKDGHPVTKKVNREKGIIFEHAKCIKCGLCVRVVTGSAHLPSLAFTGRGFMTLLSEPLTVGFSELDPENLEKGAEICPTGALAWFEKRETK